MSVSDLRPVAISREQARTINLDTCDACTLLDCSRIALRVRSFYALASAIGIDPQYPQRWYRDNRMPLVARKMLQLYIEFYGLGGGEQEG